MRASSTFLLLLAVIASTASAFVVQHPAAQQKHDNATQLNGFLDKAFANDKSLGKPQDAGKFDESFCLKRRGVLLLRPASLSQIALRSWRADGLTLKHPFFFEFQDSARVLISTRM